MTNFRSGYVTLMGPANAGKSTLLNALLGQKVSIASPKAQTTRNRVLGVVHDQDSQLVFLDTPGFLMGKPTGGRALTRSISQAAKEGAADGDVRLLVIDSSKAVSRDTAVRDIVSQLRHEGLPNPTVVALNKVDTIEKGLLLPLIAAFSEAWGDCPIIPISAKNGEGLPLLLKEIKRLLPIGPQYFPTDMVSDQTEQQFASEIIRERLIYNLRDELPYSSAVMIEGWEDTASCLKIQAVIAVERDGQKGIVIGKQGAMLKQIGTEARTQLERLFDCKIFLQLHVRVVEDWTMSDKGLSKVGLL